jgi:hypothetical protein
MMKDGQQTGDSAYQRKLADDDEDEHDDESDGLEDATTEAQGEVKVERAALMKQRNAVKTKKWRDKQRRRQDQQKDDLMMAEKTILELQEENAMLRKKVSDMQTERKRADRREKTAAAAASDGRRSAESIEKNVSENTNVLQLCCELLRGVLAFVTRFQFFLTLEHAFSLCPLIWCRLYKLMPQPLRAKACQRKIRRLL